MAVDGTLPCHQVPCLSISPLSHTREVLLQLSPADSEAGAWRRAWYPLMSVPTKPLFLTSLQASMVTLMAMEELPFFGDRVSLYVDKASRPS